MNAELNCFRTGRGREGASCQSGHMCVYIYIYDDDSGLGISFCHVPFN